MTADLTQQEPPRRMGRWLLIIAGLLALVLALARWDVLPRRTLEKAATALVLPCGACWVALTLGVALAACRRQWLWMVSLSGLWLVYTLAGNGMAGHWLLQRLERPYYELDPLDSEPVDQLVVLGGTVGYRENGKAQLTNGGDRVMLAARMYHLGKARRLVPTGSGATPDGFDIAGGAKAMAEIWQDLGIPASDITPIGGGSTIEEIRSLKELLENDPQPNQRVGLLTSAWHLPRAMRLAERQGLDVVPVPADFRTGRQPAPWNRVLDGLIPSGGGFEKTQLALKELLAGAAGR